MKKNALLIISLSARPYVEAAKLAGFNVTAIDGFVDEEVALLADQAFAVSFDAQGFNANALMQVVNALDQSQYSGCIFGGGFEAQPELLNQIGNKIPVLGNAVEVIHAVKDPHLFFQTLSSLNINYPPLISQLTPNTKGSQRVLQKQIGGSGGLHINWVTPQAQAAGYDATNAATTYQQAYIEGQSISVLFLAGIAFGSVAAPVSIIGFNEQWVSGDRLQPFKFGGMVSHIDLADTIKLKLQSIVQQLVQTFGLIGLNSIDVIVQADAVYVLEVNPRLSASFALYLQDYLHEKRVNLLHEHLNVCSANVKQQNQQAVLTLNANVANLAPKHLADKQQRKQSQAFCVVYAVNDCRINRGIVWPKWVVDVPRLTAPIMQFTKGMPICSVVANGESAAITKKILEDRVNEINTLLGH